MCVYVYVCACVRAHWGLTISEGMTACGVMPSCLATCRMRVQSPACRLELGERERARAMCVCVCVCVCVCLRVMKEKGGRERQREHGTLPPGTPMPWPHTQSPMLPFNPYPPTKIVHFSLSISLPLSIHHLIPTLQLKSCMKLRYARSSVLRKECISGRLHVCTCVHACAQARRVRGHKASRNPGAVRIYLKSNLRSLYPGLKRIFMGYAEVLCRSGS